MTIPLKKEDVQEIRVRMTVIDHEKDNLARIEKTLSHEHQVYVYLHSLLVDSAVHNDDAFYEEDKAKLISLIHQQGKVLQKLTKNRNFYKQRVSFLQDSFTFYLVQGYGLSSHVAWTIDIEQEIIIEAPT